MGFSVLRVPFVILVFLPLGLVLESCLPCSCLLYVRHLFFLHVLHFPAFFFFIFGFYFLPLFWPPFESGIGGNNSLTPSVFIIVVGIIPGVFLCVTRA